MAPIPQDTPKQHSNHLSTGSAAVQGMFAAQPAAQRKACAEDNPDEQLLARLGAVTIGSLADKISPAAASGRMPSTTAQQSCSAAASKQQQRAGLPAGRSSCSLSVPPGQRSAGMSFSSMAQPPKPFFSKPFDPATTATPYSVNFGAFKQPPMHPPAPAVDSLISFAMEPKADGTITVTDDGEKEVAQFFWTDVQDLRKWLAQLGTEPTSSSSSTDYSTSGVSLPRV
jgi:hypothetical protein